MGSMLYKNLTVWQKSMNLVEQVYGFAKSFPSYETYGLRNQITRAAISVPSNIAEGSGRKTPAEKLRFYSIARGSLYELSTQLEIASRLGYSTPTPKMISLVEEIAKMLTSMLSK